MRSAPLFGGGTADGEGEGKEEERRGEGEEGSLGRTEKVTIPLDTPGPTEPPYSSSLPPTPGPTDEDEGLDEVGDGADEEGEEDDGGLDGSADSLDHGPALDDAETFGDCSPDDGGALDELGAPVEEADEGLKDGRVLEVG